MIEALAIYIEEHGFKAIISPGVISIHKRDGFCYAYYNWAIADIELRSLPKKTITSQIDRIMDDLNKFIEKERQLQTL